MRRVLIESPYAGDIPANIAYAKQCVRDSLARGEAPFASHLFYTQDGILKDGDQYERAHGIQAGLVWGEAADATVVYMDRGVSYGMSLGIAAAQRDGRAIEFRYLDQALKPRSELRGRTIDVLVADEPGKQVVS